MFASFNHPGRNYTAELFYGKYVPRLKANLIFIVLLFLSATYFSWQIWGVRWANHDDILLNLVSHMYSDAPFEFARSVAERQARLFAYPIIPLIIWINLISNTVWYDIINIGLILAAYGCLMYLLRNVGSVVNTYSLLILLFVFFPFHYYFTIPHGYPVIFSFGLVLGLSSAVLLQSYLNGNGVWKIVLSVAMFMCSLWGEEFNLLLHPLFLLGPFVLNYRKFKFFVSVKILVPYVICWLLSMVAYFVYAHNMKILGADRFGRVAFGFDLQAWLNTFLTLEKNAILPLALMNGVFLQSLSSQGTIDFYTLFSYATNTWHVPGIYGLLTIFIATSGMSAYCLYHFEGSWRVYLSYLSLFFAVAVIPSATVAMSAHYQEIVFFGYIKGHPASFYAQLGANGIFVIIMAIFIGSKDSTLRFAKLFLSSLICGSVALLTFLYNSVVREAISENQQKWAAVALLSDYAEFHDSNLRNKKIYFPSLWKPIGVSAIPSPGRFFKNNYWSEYSKVVLNNQLDFTSESIVSNQGVVVVKYLPVSSGNPVVLLLERSGVVGGDVVTFLSSEKYDLVSRYKFRDSSGRGVENTGWICNIFCVAKISVNTDFELESIGLLSH